MNYKINFIVGKKGGDERELSPFFALLANEKKGGDEEEREELSLFLSQKHRNTSKIKKERESNRESSKQIKSILELFLIV